MLKISLDKLDKLFEAVSASKALYVPTDREDGGAEYRKYESGMKLSSALNTVRSAKDFFFPQTENLVDFKMDGKSIEVIDVREEAERRHRPGQLRRDAGPCDRGRYSGRTGG